MSSDRFEEIAQHAIGEAERVDCGFDAFVEGLETMVDEIKHRLDLAKDEQRTSQG